MRPKMLEDQHLRRARHVRGSAYTVNLLAAQMCFAARDGYLCCLRVSGQPFWPSPMEGDENEIKNDRV
jgi:hypothetical protein